MAVFMREYDSSELVPSTGIVPGLVVGHMCDAASCGIVVARSIHVMVVWSLPPLFETIKITSTKIKTTSRQLKVGWHVTMDDAVAFMNAMSVKEL